MCGELFDTIEQLNEAYPGGHAILVVGQPPVALTQDDQSEEPPPTDSAVA